ncbi:SAF domain-containing protein [Virgisporangium ochraceum]|uniref:SAF domain-containing protein n=1 Tax=Virgisporangium ochraceum TaxID=65505 RepID=UPI001EF1ACE4|nr:SAF domain-containing protein [Virgisporangium ochraceum]
MPFVALGGLLVIVSVLGYAYGAVRLGDRVQVLAVARALAAGQVITVSDLRTVSAASDPAVPLILASRAASVVGRSAVVPLLPGTLLTPSLVGEAAFPPAGKVAASVVVKPGQFPRGLVAGARVAVFVSAGAPGAGPAATAATQVRLEAAVLDVDPAGDGQGGTVVTLLVDEADSERLAAAPSGGVVLMQLTPGGG